MRDVESEKLKERIENEINTYTLSESRGYYIMTFRNSDSIGFIDAEDYELIANHRWSVTVDPLNGVPYAYTNVIIDEENYKRKMDGLHRFILKEYEDEVIIVDHIDGNGLDNRKSNLRARTQSENNMNKKIQSNNTSGFAGVSWHKKQRMWTSFIRMNGESILLGSFYYMRNALKARIEAEEEYFGEHAFYNRDEEYRKKVDEILNLPERIEPIVLPYRKSNTGIRGVHWVESKNRYQANFKKKSKKFKTLVEAVSWRKSMEREHWGGAEVLTSRDKVDKLI